MAQVQCECEHIAHNDRHWLTPNGNPGHNYGARFAPEYTTHVQTTYGKLKVCLDCYFDCCAERKEATRG